MEYGEEMDVVFVLGGDGTVHECIEWPFTPSEAAVVWDFTWEERLAMTFLQDIKDSSKCSSRLREALVNSKVRPIDIGKSNNDYFSNFWGVGLIFRCFK